ncbi:type II toxin-antitoxin system VapC family toxin [Aerophototrophica crusticola]
MYLLDTNVCVAILNSDRGSVWARYDAASRRGVGLFVSSITVFELEFGIAKSAGRRQAENRARLGRLKGDPALRFLAFDGGDAAHAGRVREHLRAAGRPIGPYDLLIAGQALARGLAVVTANMGEFGRVPGLSVEDWSAA